MKKPVEKRTGTLVETRGSGDYAKVLAGVTELLDAARRASARVVNSLMTATYWEIGRRIVEHEQAGQKRAGYGEEVVRNLSADLTRRFGRGFGSAQLAAMRQFHLTFPVLHNFQSLIGKSEIVQSVIGESSAEAIERLSPVARALRCRGRTTSACCAFGMHSPASFTCGKRWRAAGRSGSLTDRSTRSFTSAQRCRRTNP